MVWQFGAKRVEAVSDVQVVSKHVKSSQRRRRGNRAGIKVRWNKKKDVQFNFNLRVMKLGYARPPK